MLNIFLNNQLRYRIARHIVFWLLLFVLQFSSVLFFLYPRYMSSSDYSILFQTLHYDVAYFAIDVAFSYALVYWLYPEYNRSKRLAGFVMWIALLLIISLVLKWLISFEVSDGWNGSFNQKANITWLTFISFLNAGPIVRSVLFLSGKLLKDYYIKAELVQLLAQENANAELQLLKAQVHPHFLFNTLNNIYSSILLEKANATDLVSRLRNTLTYMIRDCQATHVPLTKEMEMIADYIELEKIRYGDRIKVKTTTYGNQANKMIAPLLLIPVVENCFKHGTSLMLEQSWIDIDVVIDDSALHITLKNSKPATDAFHENRVGIGISNVKKRLRLLYDKQAMFSAFSSTEVFTVAMTVPVKSV